MSDLISIIIPVYKVPEDDLRNCLDSVIHQTYEHLEIILIDDGSPDNCPLICDEYAYSDNRIKVIHQANFGLSAARNAGLKLASGEYIGFVDGDDMVSNTMYEILYHLMIKYKADVVSCCHTNAMNKLYNGGVKDFSSDDIKVIDNNVLEYYIERGYNSVWRRLYSRKIIIDKTFVVGAIDEDILFSYQIMKQCVTLVFIKKELYYWNQETVSISRSPVKNLHTSLEQIYAQKKRNNEDLMLNRKIKMRIIQFQYRVITKACIYGFANVALAEEYKELENCFIRSMRENVKFILNSCIFRPIDKLQIVLMCISLPLFKCIYKRIKTNDKKNSK